MSFVRVTFALPGDEILVNTNVRANSFLDYVRKAASVKARESIGRKQAAVTESLRLLDIKMADEAMMKKRAAESTLGGGGGGDGGAGDGGEGDAAAAEGDDAEVDPLLEARTAAKERYKLQLEELAAGWAMFKGVPSDVDLQSTEGQSINLRETMTELASGKLDRKGAYTLVRMGTLIYDRKI